MVRKRLFYIFLTCLLTIYTSVLAAQTSLQSPGLVSNTVTFNYIFLPGKIFQEAQSGDLLIKQMNT